MIVFIFSAVWPLNGFIKSEFDFKELQTLEEEEEEEQSLFSV